MWYKGKRSLEFFVKGNCLVIEERSLTLSLEKKKKKRVEGNSWQSRSTLVASFSVWLMFSSTPNTGEFKKTFSRKTS